MNQSNERYSIILLTFNEEQNLPDCLRSMAQLNAPIFAVDSFSTDHTLDILEANKIPYLQHTFENYACQRNWAQANSPYDTNWVFHLDAGERMTPELVQWLNEDFDPDSSVDGYMFSRRTMFFGKWIKYGGHYPNYHLRLYHTSKGHCENKVYDQHFIVEGNKEVVPAGIDIIDTVTDTIRNFTVSHARWAQLEAAEILSATKEKGEVQVRFFGSPIERRRWLKNNVFQKTPLFLRSFFYFFYRYFLRFGFLDGKLGLVFHLLQGFWFRFLIDAIVLELSLKPESSIPVTEDHEKKPDHYILKDSSMMRKHDSVLE
uniref:Glycosyltransferase family 2 protein n=1 Tax=Roseihalotalea indica TaxID=2867963 RepID=A0AA49GJ65_9BACT|nr:glycosyltransferase family 2 protein [Tunicatimonas sp. TK19036]